jgi:hypothetical protein
MGETVRERLDLVGAAALRAHNGRLRGERIQTGVGQCLRQVLGPNGTKLSLTVSLAVMRPARGKISISLTLICGPSAETASPNSGAFSCRDGRSCHYGPPLQERP